MHGIPEHCPPRSRPFDRRCRDSDVAHVGSGDLAQRRLCTFGGRRRPIHQERRGRRNAPHVSVEWVQVVRTFRQGSRGAGHAHRIGQNIPEVVAFALRRLEACECGAETSCYKCLRAYSNQMWHEELSRRSAINVLRQLLPSGSSRVAGLRAPGAYLGGCSPFFCDEVGRLLDIQLARGSLDPNVKFGVFAVLNKHGCCRCWSGENQDRLIVDR